MARFGGVLGTFQATGAPHSRWEGIRAGLLDPRVVWMVFCYPKERFVLDRTEIDR